MIFKLHNEQTLFHLIEEATIEAYGDDYKLYFESIRDYILQTEISQEFLNEASDFEGESIELQEYVTAETPLALIPDTELLEAVLELFYEKSYSRDKDGKVITGLHKGTNRYTGTRKERVAKAVKAYYDKGDNREKHNADMRRRYRLKKRKAAERGEKPKKRGRPEKPQNAAKRKAKETDNTGLSNPSDPYAKDARLEGVPKAQREDYVKMYKYIDKHEPALKGEKIDLVKFIQYMKTKSKK